QRQHALEAAQPDAGVDLEMGTHMGGAVENAALERALGARVDILRRERRLQPRDLADGGVEIAVVGVAAIEDAGLVEMQMRLDEAGRHQPAADVELLRLGRQGRLDGGDLAARDADVGQAAVAEACLTQDEIHGSRTVRISVPEVYAENPPP